MVIEGLELLAEAGDAAMELLESEEAAEVAMNVLAVAGGVVASALERESEAQAATVAELAAEALKEETLSRGVGGYLVGGLAVVGDLGANVLSEALALAGGLTGRHRHPAEAEHATPVDAGDAQNG